MNTALALLFGVVPTAFWLWFFLRKDRDPEPRRLLLRTFCYGMLAWVVAAALQGALGVSGWGVQASMLGILAVLVIALSEEACKLLAASTTLHEPSFDDHLDGLMYAVTAALGFALLENISYGLSYGAPAALYHGLLTTLAHALFSAPLGYALAQARFGCGRGWRLRGLLIATALHAAFNGLLSEEGRGSPTELLALGAVVLLMALLSRRYYRELGYRQLKRLQGGR